MILRKSNAHAVAGLWALLIFSAAASAQVSAASEAVLIKRAAQLRDGPGDSSRVLVALPLQTSVIRLGERQGPWIKVRLADGTQGWVHMFDITAASTPQGGNAGTGALRSISGFFNKGSAQANASTLPTSTVGIRGLGAEDLANAQPNMAAVAQIDGSRLDAGQAQQFATLASLSSRTVSPLPAPAAPARAPAAGGGRNGAIPNNSGGQFQGGN